MARPRQFDEKEVRDRVTDLFTSRGYHATSVNLIAAELGLGKQSLYNSFGDKQSLYLQSLDCAGERLSGARAAMAAEPTGRDALVTFFEVLVALCASADPTVHTCIVSAGLLEGIEEAAVADRLREKWNEVRRLLRDAVVRGQRDGSVRSDLKPGDLANLLMTLMSGLRVTARAVDSAAALKSIVRIGLQVVEPPP